MARFFGVTLITILMLVSLGGASGQTAQAAYGGFSAQNSGISTNLHAIACPARNTCYAVGELGRILATTDGGRTWRSQRNPLSGLTALNAIACPAVRTCYVAGGYMVAAAGPSGFFPPAEGAILATSDGGRTWRQERSHLGYTLLTGIACPSTSHCVIVGDAGRILTTADSGRSWRPVQGAARFELFGVACAGARSCTAIGTNGSAIASTDGGADWVGGQTSTLPDLRGVACPLTGECVAVGAGGSILRSTDGGLSWAAATVPYASSYFKPSLKGVACATARVCYTVGLGNVKSAFLGSADGGRTWTDLGASTTAILESASCPNTSTCYAVGSQGAIVKTTVANPGSGYGGSSTGTAVGGQTGGTGSITLDQVVISLTPNGSQAYILHKQSPAYFTAYFRATTSGATGTVSLQENGSTLGTYPLTVGTAPDGQPTLYAAVNMSTFPAANITAQFTVRLGSTSTTQTATSLLLAD